MHTLHRAPTGSIHRVAVRSLCTHERIRLIIALFMLVGMCENAFAAPPLRLSPNKLADGTQYGAYSEVLTANGGTPPYSWSFTGILPTGLTLTPAGATASLSGIPTVVNTYNFRIIITDGATPTPDTDFIDYTVTVTTSACTFSGSNSGGISFFPFDPSTPTSISGTPSPQISVICTAGKAFTVAATPASGWTIVSSGNTIPFTLGFVTSGTGAGATPVDLLTTSTILQADYQSMPVGTYANTSAIDLTVSWTAPAGSITATLPIGSVSGTLSDTCTTPVSGAINFTIDPSFAGPLNPSTADAGNTAPTVKCTNQGGHLVVCTSSHNFKLTKNNDGVTDPIAYSITGCPPSITGSGFVTAVPINFGLQLNASGLDGYQNAEAGAHSDIITVQVDY